MILSQSVTKHIKITKYRLTILDIEAKEGRKEEYQLDWHNSFRLHKAMPRHV